MNAFFLFISGGEIIFILFIVVMIFGADKLPEIARGLAKGMTQLKNATNEIKSEITKSADGHGLDTGFVKDIQNEINKVKDVANDVKSDVLNSASEHGLDLDTVKNIKKQVDGAKEGLDNLTGPIKRRF